MSGGILAVRPVKRGRPVNGAIRFWQRTSRAIIPSMVIPFRRAEIGTNS